MTGGPDYRERFEASLAPLGQDTRFSGVSLTLGGPMETAVLARARKELGHHLPESMAALYGSMNGLSASWTMARSGKDPLTGDIHLLPLEEALGGPEGMAARRWNHRVFEDILWFEDYPAKTKKFLKSCKRFQPIRGFSAEIVLRLGEGVAPPELYLLHRDQYFPLGVDFDRYLQLLLETRGTGYWQYLLLGEADRRELNLRLPRVEDIVEAFPGARIEELRS